MSRDKTFSNFTDLFGLLGRMLTSGNRAAYSALFREGLRLGAIPLDCVLSVFEKRRLTRETTSQHPLIFIVGAPRSGTTLIYQALATFLDVTCPTNLTAMFPRSPLTAARLQQSMPSSRRPDFRNFYGQTTQLSGPNDAFHLWNRWLGDDRYLPTVSITEAVAAEMRQFLNAWVDQFGKPFLNKNNRNAFAIELLAQRLPNARFVVVRRNPVFVAQSLIVARQQVQGDKAKGWGLQSSSTSAETDPLAYVDDVCRQIVSIDAEMDRQLATVSASRVVDLTYEGFCENPALGVSRVASAFDGLELNSRLSPDDLSPFEVSRKLTISHEEQARIQECLSDPLVTSLPLANA